MLKLQRWGLLATIVALAALFVIDGAQSRRRPHQPQQPTETQPQPPQQATPSDQRGTEQSPLSVKVIPTPQSEEDAAHERQEREEKAELDRKLVKFNGDLAYYTELLFWVAFSQFGALFIQALILGATFFIARAALRDLERALIFGGPYIANPSGSGQGTVIIMPQCSNYGRSFALLQEIRIGTDSEEPISSTPDYSQLESHRYDFVINPNAQPFIDGHVIITRSTADHVYCFGYFKYLDIFRREHTSRFCVRVLPDFRMETVGHPAWNEWD
jgi:hypothetical protein